MSERNIVLVDDNRDDLELGLRILKKHYPSSDIVVLEDGVEAIEYLYRRGDYADREPGNPRLILLDIKMPRMNGLEVLKEIKNDPAIKNIPVVMLTSSKLQKDITTSYDLHANAYVIKPADFSQFAEVMQAIGLFWLACNEPPADGMPFLI